MRTAIKIRLLSFGLAIAALTVMIAWAANRTLSEIAHLQQRFGSGEVISFQIADHLQSTILMLNNELVRYQMRRNPAQWQRFQKNSDALNRWIDQQKPELKTRRELALLNKIDAEYDNYLRTATNAVEESQRSSSASDILAGLERTIDASMKMLGLGYQLADAHRAAFEMFLISSQASFGTLQRFIFGGLVLLLGLGVGLSITVYRDMIAPLRLKLVESRAIIEGQEKLASLGALAAGVAHEVRNPLTAIKARLFTQEKSLAKGSPAYEDGQVINSEINRLERIVKDFLLFARPGDPQFETIDAQAPLREVCALMEPQLRRDEIALAIEEHSPGAEIRVDPQQLKQVLLNLVQNAADAIGKRGAVTLRARSETRRSQDGPAQVIVLEVADTGKGISPEVEKRLFDPFFTTKEGGTGLGLSIAASLVEKNGGTLQYQTQLRQGTVFGIVLPRQA